MAETTFHSITLPGRDPARVPLTAIEFNPQTNYKVRDYCTYQGILYRCTTTHSAGTWDSTKNYFTATNSGTNVGDELTKRLVVPPITEPASTDRRIGDLWIDTDTESPVISVDPQPIAGSTNVPSSGGTFNAIQSVEDRKANKSLLTGEFSPSSPYSVNNLCIHDGYLYRCKVDIPTGTAWDSSKWETTTIKDELARIESEEVDLDVIAETFGNSSSYAVGDYVLHTKNGVDGLYRCTNAVSETSVWNSQYWSEVKLADEVSDLKSALNSRNDLYINGETLITPKYLNRNFTGGIPTTPSNIRLISEAIPVPPEATIGITQNTSGTAVALCRFDANGTRLDITYANSQETIVANCDHISVYIQYSDNSPITPEDGLTIATVKFHYTNPLEEEVESLSDIKITTTTKLLFNRNAIVLGKYMNKGGGIVDSSSYAYTPKIDVSNHVGDTMYFSNDGVARGVRYITAFNSNNDAVSASGVDDGSMTTTTYTIPSGIVAVVITIYNPTTNANYNHFQAEWDEITGYIPTPTITEINPSFLPYGATDFLTGKKWAVCGDSFTDGATNTKISGGIYDGKNYVYPYLIGNRTGIEILKFFRGGKTLANPADGTFTNSLTNPNAPGAEYYQNIPADVDYITIYLGINDGNHETGSGTTPDGEDATGVITLGTINDDTIATYYGAWNVVLTWMLTNRPFAHIGIIVSNGCKNSDWAEAQRLIARKYGIPYLDLNGDDRCRAMIRPQNSNIPNTIKEIIKQSQAVDPSTNTHPNDAAHLLESTFIENFLRSI